MSQAKVYADGAELDRSAALRKDPGQRANGGAMETERTSREAADDRRPLRVVVAEDTALLREGIVSLLREEGHQVVGQARTADELLLKVRSYLPDVAIVDMRMPPTHTDEGLVAEKQIR